MAFCDQCGTPLSEGARFCSGCGTAVQSAPASGTGETTSSATAPHIAPPGAPPHTVTHDAGMASPPAVSSGRGIGGLILPVMVVVAILVISYLLVTGRKTDQAATPSSATAVGGTDAPIAADDRRAVDAASDAAAAASDRTRAADATTSATVLDSAFFTDPRSAAQRYAGRVRVSGVIASMVMPGRTPSLAMEGRNRFNYIVVNFPDGYRERLAPLAKGQFITIACDGAEPLAGTTILSGCLLD